MNNKTQNSYRKASDSIAFSEDFNEKTISRLRTESGKAITVKNKYRHKIVKICACAAAALLVISGTAGYALRGGSIELSNSSGVSARYTITPRRGVTSSDSLVYLNESEIIGMSDFIAAGKVTKIENITVSFGVGNNEYWSLVTFKPDSILKGNAAEKSEIKFLVHCQLVSREVWVEDNDVIEKLKTGDRAIFMLKKYDATSTREENGNTLYYTDLCEYGLPNGIQFAVIETEDGLAFGHDIFGFDSATTFEQAVNHFSGIIG